MTQNDEFAALKKVEAMPPGVGQILDLLAVKQVLMFGLPPRYDMSHSLAFR